MRNSSRFPSTTTENYYESDTILSAVASLARPLIIILARNKGGTKYTDSRETQRLRQNLKLRTGKRMRR